ncbi:DAD family-domain-containing protein [Myxozyma melibiosi]|uniref:Dolichyl-diphosphooligosaccharide--protein glycosyltransferase subunit OST2 n=1 Tax=Myxozyma melibiosi TaxID=54550 RepID=A0ABR1F410_9ASCO
MAPKKQVKPPKSVVSKSGTASTSAGGVSGSSSPTVADTSAIIADVVKTYVRETPRKLKLVDAFMGFLVAVGVLQFAYCVVVTSYPFNAFLSGFSITVGQFVLAASLRVQANPENSSQFDKVSPERAFADFVFGSLILHFFAYNFIN